MSTYSAIIGHRETGEYFHVKSKTDLAHVLGVSLRTITRKYSEPGCYVSTHYNIYVATKIYDRGVAYRYKRDVSPPVAKVYRSKECPQKPNFMDNLSTFSQYCGHEEEGHEEEVEDSRDWRDIERSLAISEYDSYYSGRTLKELEDSKRYFLRDTIRLTYIDKYGEKKLSDVF